MATKKKTEEIRNSPNSIEKLAIELGEFTREIKPALRKFKWIHTHGEEIIEAENVITAKMKCHEIATQKGWRYKRVFRDFYEVTP